jgi:alkanesulfonate monooxygenase SsuD/methylene tetrahydromethanopterin reductase-like flavin-dependent oxidoreductase (luciferase family)
MVKIGVDADYRASMVPVADLARTIEDAGFESLVFMQSTHVPLASEERHEPIHRGDEFILDPVTVLAAAAAVTSRLRLGT